MEKKRTENIQVENIELQAPVLQDSFRSKKSSRPQSADTNKSEFKAKSKLHQDITNIDSQSLKSVTRRAKKTQSFAHKVKKQSSNHNSGIDCVTKKTTTRSLKTNSKKSKKNSKSSKTNTKLTATKVS